MDWGQLLLWTGANLVITALAYLLVPTIVILSKKKCEAKTIGKIVIINCIVVWVLFRVVELTISDEASTGAAVFLWGSIGYFLLRKFCLKEKQPTTTSSTQSIEHPPRVHVCLSDPDEVPVKHGSYHVDGSDIRLVEELEQPKTDPVREIAQPIQPVEKTLKFCSRCGYSIDPITKKCISCGKQYFKGVSGKTVCIILLAVLLAVSLVGNIVLCVKNVELNTKTDNLGQNNIQDTTPTASGNYVGVRTITLGEIMAEYVLLRWQDGEATEETLIEIFDKYGASQGGGQLYMIQRGEFVKEIDDWCFSADRQVGDIAIIENAYGFSICYISSIG